MNSVDCITVSNAVGREFDEVKNLQRDKTQQRKRMQGKQKTKEGGNTRPAIAQIVLRTTTSRKEGSDTLHGLAGRSRMRHLQPLGRRYDTIQTGERLAVVVRLKRDSTE